MRSSECAKKASEHKLVSVSEIVDQAKHGGPLGHDLESADDPKEHTPVVLLSRKKALGQLLFRAAVLLGLLAILLIEVVSHRIPRPARRAALSTA